MIMTLQCFLTRSANDSFVVIGSCVNKTYCWVITQHVTGLQNVHVI